ncbi:MAG: TIGR02452 family protein [Acutalibacteraceae bacterium]
MPNYKAITDETVKILDNGEFIADLKRITLDMDKLKKVIRYPDKQLIQLKSEQNFNTEFKVYERDTVSAALACPLPEKCAVLNFASAKHPGGGFITGANAQEESLCRSSSLYASIGSKDAEDMYIYNTTVHKSRFYSDYMLFSPNVAFFRRFNGSLTSKYAVVSVITAPAVNCRIADPVKNADKIRKIMQARIRKIFDIAILNDKTYLILGAWGCGVFGHKTEDIANDFRLVLSEEKYKNAFEVVEFSVLCGRNSSDILPFRKTFGKAKI